MATKSITSRIRAAAVEILSGRPEGIRYSELQRLSHERDAAFKLNTIAGAIYNPDTTSAKVEKPTRGLYRIAGQESVQDPSDQQPSAPKEETFYRPFADWLKNELEDVTKATPLGGNRFKDKWGTPDVIGKRDSKPSDIIKPPIEIVSAEIKTNANQLITAFGQACAYCLFSHRSYLVAPRQAAPEEVSRLDSLCQVFGIGLVLFDASNPEDPRFEARSRPRKQEPDPHYINKYMKEVESELFR